MISKSHPSHSLRTRYLLLIAGLGVTIFVIALWGHHTLTSAGENSTAQLQARQDVRRHSLQVRVALFESYKSLNAFLLDPARTEHRDRTQASLNRAIFDSDRLLTDTWIINHGQQREARELKNALVALGVDITGLTETRMDPVRQFPSMAISAQQMKPNNDRFNDAINLAIRESRQHSSLHDTALSKLIEVRHLWTQMVSTYRLYVANRMGSFNEESLPDQEHAVATIYKAIDDALVELRQPARVQQLGFQSLAALHEMREALRLWFAAFNKVKEIHATSDWRADGKLIKERVEPRLNSITALLGVIEQAITDAAKQDLDKLGQSTRDLTRLGWGLGGLGVLLVGLLVLSLDRLVFRPIRQIADALKAEAYNQQDSPLPAVSYREAQDLVDAFAEMRKQVHQRQSALQHEATHDTLTGLPNRALLLDRMAQAIQVARRNNRSVTFMMMDLDRFKDINDTLGHQVGDQLLTDVSERLSETLREADTISRMGGDEFGVLLSNTTRDDAPQVARKINEALAAPVQIRELRLYIGASIGIATYPDDGEDAAALVQRADVAMYVAKDNQTRFALYQQSQDNYSIGRLALMGDLRTALQQNSLALHFQPKLSMADNQVSGAEALLRWQHPAYGPIPPDQVVSLAEHTGLIGALTYWVLDQALATAARWHRQGTPLNLAVNLSVHNLRDRDFQRQVRECLAAHRFPPESLTLEITEHAMMSNRADAMEVLKELDVLGVRLSVDDYGTGFSSLAYLKQLPVDELKIDKSFVMRMHHNPNDEVIVHSTIDLAHNLGLSVVAEGVESSECWDRLAELGCDTAQGFYMSPPLSIEAFDAWLAER